VTDVGKQVIEFSTNSGPRRDSAFSELVKSFQDMAVGVAYSVLGDFHTAQDVAQESFLTAYVEIDQLGNPDAFPGWFRQIVVRKCGRLLRSSGRFLETGRYLESIPQQGRSPEAKLEDRERDDLVQSAIAALPENERLVTILFYLTGYSTNQIATMLDVSISAVKKRLQRAREHLKDRMINMTADALQNHRPSQNRSFSDDLLSMIKASQDGDLTQIVTLLERNPELSKAKIERLGDLEFQHEGATPPHYAAWCGNIEAAQLLLDYGADIDLMDDSYHSPPVGWAGENRQDEMVQFLVDRGAKITIGQIAAWGSLEDLKRRIREVPSLVNDGTGAESDRWSPLWKAAGWDRKDVVEFLLEEGADVNAITRSRQTPILGAAQSGNVEIVKLLIDAGADVSVRFKDGRTALHKAAEVKSGPTTELLISEGVELDVAKNTGETALHFAAWGRSREVVAILVAHGANVTTKDQKGRTPLDMALIEDGEENPNERKAKASDPEIMAILRKATGQ
jgi:RNA polymerase sigma factor (sigma-70 family)